MRKQGLDPNDKSARDVLKRYQKTVTNPNATDKQIDVVEREYEDLMWASGVNGSTLQASTGVAAYLADARRMDPLFQGEGVLDASGLPLSLTGPGQRDSLLDLATGPTKYWVKGVNSTNEADRYENGVPVYNVTGRYQDWGTPLDPNTMVAAKAVAQGVAAKARTSKPATTAVVGANTPITSVNFQQNYINNRKYDPIIAKAAAENGIPPEVLKAKFALESRFNPKEVNGEYVGIAQFDKTTAENYGLTVDGKIDQRLNPELAIPAAAQYLGDLRNLFADNALNENDKLRFALAAYNIGPKKVNLQLDIAKPFMVNSKVPYNHPSMSFHKGTYVPNIIGLEGDIGALAGMYKNDFLRGK